MLRVTPLGVPRVIAELFQWDSTHHSKDLSCYIELSSTSQRTVAFVPLSAREVQSNLSASTPLSDLLVQANAPSIQVTTTQQQAVPVYGGSATAVPVYGGSATAAAKSQPPPAYSGNV